MKPFHVPCPSSPHTPLVHRWATGSEDEPPGQVLQPSPASACASRETAAALCHSGRGASRSLQSRPPTRRGGQRHRGCGSLEPAEGAEWGEARPWSHPVTFLLPLLGPSSSRGHLLQEASRMWPPSCLFPPPTSLRAPPVGPQWGSRLRGLLRACEVMQPPQAPGCHSLCSSGAQPLTQAIQTLWYGKRRAPHQLLISPPRVPSRPHCIPAHRVLTVPVSAWCCTRNTFHAFLAQLCAHGWKFSAALRARSAFSTGHHFPCVSTVLATYL